MAIIKHDLDIVSEFPDHFIIGVDEVGRGALAGPVVMGAVALNYAAFAEPNIPVRDSKELTPSQRESIISFYENDGRGSVLYRGVIDCSAAAIDERGIETALDHCFQSLLRSLHAELNIPYAKMVVLLDGDRERKHPDDLRDVICLARPKADDYYVCTALSSVYAKVRRDADMRTLHEEHPDYGWDSNKGYGNALHQSMIQEHGITAYHRRTFIH